MKIFLVFLPIITIIFGFFIHRFSGRREIMKMDLVQFIYTFIIIPTILIWIKSVVFFNLNNADIVNEPEDKFFIDTIVTIFSFYFYAFIVMHSLTKTFAIKKDKDPLFDIFEHAEYFHLWLSHMVTYSGALFIIFVLGVLNIYSPLPQLTTNINLYVGLIIGLVFSLLFFRAVANYKVEGRKKFDRIMKLQIYSYTFLLALTYIIFKPNYYPQYSVYWCSVAFFIFSVIFSQILSRTSSKYLLRLSAYKELVKTTYNFIKLLRK